MMLTPTLDMNSKASRRANLGIRINGEAACPLFLNAAAVEGLIHPSCRLIHLDAANWHRHRTGCCVLMIRPDPEAHFDIVGACMW
jgi:hypothetical protein